MRVELWMENRLAVDAYNSAVALQCSLLDVLREWGFDGDDRDEIVRKVRVIVDENDAWDRKRLEETRNKSKGR